MTGHGLGGYNSEPHGLGSYWKLEHDGGNTASPNDRVVVKLYEEHQKFDWPIQGFILKTSAGTLTAKSSNAAAVSACAGAVGHTDSSGKQVAEAYLDLPSSEGTVTVTAELVASKTSVYKLTLAPPLRIGGARRPPKNIFSVFLTKTTSLRPSSTF